MGQLTKKITLLILMLIPFAFLFGIYDLDISIDLVNQNSSWAIFLENYGMIPGLIVILSGVYIYYSHIKQRSDVWSYVQKVIFFLVSSGLIFYLFEILLDKIVINNLIVFLSVAFSISLIIFIVLHQIEQVKNPITIKYSRVVVGMTLFGYVIGIQVVKYLWGRIRFRELDAAFSNFTPWYCPQGITGFDSFPSGHAATGFMLLSLMILLNNKKQWIKNLALSIIIFWGVLLASSRVVIGAHYASDVLFGSFFIILTFILLNRNSNKQTSDNK